MCYSVYCLLVYIGVPLGPVSKCMGAGERRYIFVYGQFWGGEEKFFLLLGMCIVDCTGKTVCGGGRMWGR